MPRIKPKQEPKFHQELKLSGAAKSYKQPLRMETNGPLVRYLVISPCFTLLFPFSLLDLISWISVSRPTHRSQYCLSLSMLPCIPSISPQPYLDVFSFCPFIFLVCWVSCRHLHCLFKPCLTCCLLIFFCIINTRASFCDWVKFCWSIKYLYLPN